MNDIFEKLTDPSAWERYYAYKAQKEPPDSKSLQRLREYVDSGTYRPVAERLKNGSMCLSPEKKLISKGNVSKKRTVYTFPPEESFLLKFIAHQLKDYDRCFAPNLYSFRVSKTAKSAWEHLLKIKNLDQKYVYKLDISNYFCSVNPERLLPELRAILQKDAALYQILEQLLLDAYVFYDGKLQKEAKGILPGVPVSSFLANLYLRDLDWFFYRNQIAYLRYSDDIIVFAESREQLADHIAYIKAFLADRELAVNTDKEIQTEPGQQWEFLGFSYCGGIVDVSPVAFQKLKAKIRRKSRALVRWADQKNLPGEYAAKALVKRFHAKLYNNPVDNELTWTQWYFPIINTDRTLRLIDNYMQDTIRAMATGKHTKSRFDYRYADIKKLGYHSLVNAFYRWKAGKPLTDDIPGSANAGLQEE